MRKSHITASGRHTFFFILPYTLGGLHRDVMASLCECGKFNAMHLGCELQTFEILSII